MHDGRLTLSGVAARAAGAVRAVSTASSAATAASAARSSCRMPVDAERDHRRPARRRARPSPVRRRRRARAAHSTCRDHERATPCPRRAAARLRLRRRPGAHRPHARGATDAGAQAPARRRSPLRVRPASPPRPPRRDFTARRRAHGAGGRQHLVAAGRPPAELPVANDPFFRTSSATTDMFGSRRGVESSLGSGVIVSADGYILTNNHVVTGESRTRLAARAAARSRWRSPTSARCRREIIGVDPATDLALLKVDARNLPTMPWGDSSKLKVAEWVLAIGNPFQLNQTVTLGIVSAVGRHEPRHLGLRGLHPDRRGDQSGQLRRRAGQRARRAGRHQHGDLQRRAAATRGSASPCRATSRAASSPTCSSTARCGAARSATSRSRR